MLVDLGVAKWDIKLTYDVDAVDRLKYVYTVALLNLMALFVFSKQYVGESVQCWAPQHFSGFWEQYVEQYCLIENTFFVSMDDQNMPSTQQRENSELRYYQWVPFLLVALSALLFLPRIVWKAMQSLIGLKISDVTVHMRKCAKASLDDVDHEKLDVQRKKLTKQRRSNKDIEWGNRLTLCLLTTKLLSLLAVVFTLFFLDYFMDIGPAYGLQVVVDVLSGREWKQSGKFPKSEDLSASEIPNFPIQTTFCDFEVRELGQVNRWSLQCVLMVNMFNEKIFVLLWWWYLGLFVVSVYDLLDFLQRCTASRQTRLVRSVLYCCEGPDDINDDVVASFTRSVLKTDGVNLLQLIINNSTIFQAADFLKPFWESYAHT
ncbi:unnamed protein product [Caenorhabditis auriculariae]|uniref:Innexin n=1 Tax=Caenorhabditis auriculariae TaxID=2777116 RepID=A0A8S1HK66_9PELO|nr:unnamed protein product [Caenorhabditis auriculariae]